MPFLQLALLVHYSIVDTEDWWVADQRKDGMEGYPIVSSGSVVVVLLQQRRPSASASDSFSYSV